MCVTADKGYVCLPTSIWVISKAVISPISFWLSHDNWWFLWMLSEGTELCCTPQGRSPPSPLSLVVYTYLVSAPRPWQQLVLRFGWKLITPWRSPAKKREGFLKGVNWGCLFWVTLFRTGKSDSMCRVMCSMCRVCATRSLLGSPHPGNNFRSPTCGCSFSLK